MANSEKVTKEIIEKLMQSSGLTKLKLYQTLQTKIANGEKLSATELKTFNQLDAYFSKDIDTGPPEELIDNFDEAAKYAGVSKRTIKVWITKGWIRQNEDGTFRKAEIDRHLENSGRKKTQPEKIDERIVKADLRWRLARARREEMLVAQLKGSLFSRQDVVVEWCGRVSAVVSALEAFADRLPPLLDGKVRDEMREIIKAEVWELRNSFVRHGRYCPPCDTDAESGE